VIAEIAVIARDRKTKSSPLMNAADTDQESVIGKAKPLTIADIGRDRKTKSSPLMDTADTDQESVIGKAKPLMIAEIARHRRHRAGSEKAKAHH
jgi:hypothetical protein